MQTHRMKVVIPENHQLLISVPETIRAGTAELILVVPENESAREETPSPEPRGRLKKLAEELAADPRPFRELSLEEREARLRRSRGVGRGLMSTSEEFARQKQFEIELEERRFAR